MKVLPSLNLVSDEDTRQELLQLMAEGCLYPLNVDMAVKCLQPVFDFLLVSIRHTQACIQYTGGCNPHQYAD